MINATKSLMRFLGIDRAVFFSNATQMIRLVSGPITIALVMRYLTPEIQGYFYAFSGIVAMQIFLEMGFSQNILQFASHEFANLHFTSASTLEGNPESLSRLISLGRLAFCYYAVAALIVFFAIGIGGHVFFSLSGSQNVAWQGAWWMVVTVAALSLAINPAWALLDGCNQVAIVARFRLWVSLVLPAVNAAALIAGCGIYVSAVTSAVSLLCSIGYLYFRWKPFFYQFLDEPRHGRVSWIREIWPFQWRIAVSWMSGYFIFDMINPIAFYFSGAVEAGRLGMSLQLVRTISNVAMTWIYTKAPRFGMLVSSKQWKELDTLWRRSATQSFLMCVLGMCLFMAAIPLVGHFMPQVPKRLAPLDVTAWLAGAMLVQVLTGCMALELRAHKKEPYMWLSVVNAVLSILYIVPLTHYWGIYGEAVGYALSIWTIFIPAVKVYRVKRLEYRKNTNGEQNDQSAKLSQCEAPLVS